VINVRLGLVSDLHLDRHSNYLDIMESIDSQLDDVNILILAGDIAEIRNPVYSECIEYFCRRDLEVVTVFGNHEFYFTKREHIYEVRTSLTNKFDNLHFFDNTYAVLKGVRFYGGTMWFPRSNSFHKREMNDFRAIELFEDWVYDSNREFTEGLQSVESSIDVVVSHHLPSWQCVDMKFVGSPLNAFFVSDHEELIKQLQPKYWLFGHRHSPHESNVGLTRLISNPLGYPSRRSSSGNFECLKLMVEV
jgi:Icc-related predicted phosphoesterase